MTFHEFPYAFNIQYQSLIVKTLLERNPSLMLSLLVDNTSKMMLLLQYGRNNTYCTDEILEACEAERKIIQQSSLI